MTLKKQGRPSETRFAPAVGVPFLILQCVCIALLIWSDTSDGYQRSYGPNWCYVFLLVGSYLGLLLAGLTVSFSQRDWLTTGIQVAVLLSVFAAAFWPDPVYDVAELQQLKSERPSSVKAMLGTRGRLTGFRTYRGETREVWSYRGVEIIFSNGALTEDERATQHVIAIEAHPRD